ncbi:MAG: hypothetical protein A3B23_02135 [Candidatus Colwellbacteria bacterium RIFCSPLOWO2_01_FULL_48_10]|uniref:Uncharacterized protein n=1 Tax=Candidatus Colwellbacteria bacterium RIFCSPLOWO2_01_FULL_48_10 TaxID=1797690 RepID=A0A1G1Z8G1_9BACT|nr:MAG: hypothetical protein A3B23_02135 [Candidatus Colwellbacteria bacterium RIFCSPLOWO2_01_FULL_48_10]
MAKFYKDIKVIKWCRKCTVEFRPIRYTWQNQRLICTKCVAKEITVWRKKNPDKWREIVRRYRKKARSKRLPWVVNAYLSWKRWVANNPQKRKDIAKRSYHKNKSLGT